MEFGIPHEWGIKVLYRKSEMSSRCAEIISEEFGIHRRNLWAEFLISPTLIDGYGPALPGERMLDGSVNFVREIFYDKCYSKANNRISVRCFHLL